MGNEEQAIQSITFCFVCPAATSPTIQWVLTNRQLGSSFFQASIRMIAARQKRNKFWTFMIQIIMPNAKMANLVPTILYNKYHITMRMIGILISLSLVSLALGAGTPGCPHPVFCNETILSAVANSTYYTDSKSFVDAVLTVPIEQALKQFSSKPITQFLNDCFTSNNTVLQPIDLPDWQPNPESLAKITTPELKAYALDLNKRWNQLSRKVDLTTTSTNCTKQCSTFLPELDGRTIIVPGGRFDQSYYWDTYWIIKGLIACDLLESAQILVQNFILVLQKYGFIPNGFRDYYLNRSQPPFFALMVKELVEAYRMKGQKAKADQLEQRAFYPLVQQHNFFMKTHSRAYKLKSSKSVLLNFYNAETTAPRPESYRQDMQLVQNITNTTEKQRILKGVSSMAESGWDFSSRWLTNITDLTTNVIVEMFPSDLNTLMAMQESYLMSLATKFGRMDLFSQYQKLYNDRKEYFTEIFNGWYYPDSCKLKQRPLNQVYPSDFYPFLLFNDKVVDLKSIFNDVVNPVSSIFNNGQQWDKPNVWAPNNWILHEVLEGKDSFRFAQEWVSTTYCSWKKQSALYEKYMYNVLGQRGQGGEYTVQVGFGWTNGLALYYLKLYGDELQVPTCL